MVSADRPVMSTVYLLDSQVWVWHLNEPERLRDPVRSLIRSGRSQVTVTPSTA